jgi:PAS domain S-box-containing protein
MNLRSLRDFLFSTLQGRLILSVAAVHAAMMTLFVLDLTIRQRAMILDNQTEGAIAMSQSLATSAAVWIAANDLSGLQELVEAETLYPEVLFAIIADEHGNVLANTDKSKRGLYLLDLPQDVRLTVLSKSAAMVDVATPAMLSNRHVGWVRIGIGQKTASEKLAGITQRGAMYAFAAILIGSLIAWHMGRRITQRLYTVQNTIGEVRRGVRTARSKVKGNDEAASIAQEFNAMLDMLDERDHALLQSELKCHSLLRNIHAAIVVHDPNTRILTSNPMAQSLLGFSEEQMAGKTVGELPWHFLRENGSEMPMDQYPVNLALASCKPVRNRIVGVQKPDGAERLWILVNADPMLDERGVISEVIVTFINITEHKLAEEAVRSANAYNRSLIEASPDPLVTIGPNGKITDVNTATETVTGYRREKLVGTDFSDYFTDPEKARAGYREVFQKGSVRDYPLEIQHRNGQVTSVLYNATVYRDEQGQAKGVFAAARDITERKQAEQKIIHLASIVESSDDAIIGKGLDGTVTSWNRGAEKIYGYSADEMIGRSVSLLVPPGRENQVPLILERIARGEHIEHHETVRRRKDGKDIFMSLTISPVRDAEGRIVAASTIGRDITEHKQVEEEIHQLNLELEQRVLDRTTQLEAANKELEAFSYSVSHDLRAPLRHIDGFMELLQKRTATSLDTQSQHYMATISDSARRMGMLIDDLLSFSRMGRHEMSRMPVNLGALVVEVVREFDLEVKTRTVNWRIAPLPVVSGDPAMLRIVLVNLISNALKFTQPRQEAEIKIDCAPGKETETVVYVRDNGVGFDPDCANKLFGVFQRLHRVDEFEGIGIGLANVRRIITRHGGRTWAEGKLGQGATFYFSLPRTTQGG